MFSDLFSQKDSGKTGDGGGIMKCLLYLIVPSKRFLHGVLLVVFLK